MSKKITTKEMIEFVKHNIIGGDFKIKFMNYLTQQEQLEKDNDKLVKELGNNYDSFKQKYAKQQKLLELYRKLLKLEQDDFNELYKGNSEEYFKEWNKTFEQIKELENESNR